MEYFYCGIDVSKDSLDYAVCNQQDKNILLLEKTDNTISGIRKMIKLIERKVKSRQVWYCFEHTGHYGLLLAHILQSQQQKYSMVASIDIIKSSGLTRGKSDPIDAQRIAIYAATFTHKLKPTKLQSESVLRMKTMLTIRDHYVRIRTQLKNAHKSMIITSKVVPMKTEINDYKREIARYDIKITRLEKRIIELINQDNDLKQSYDKIIKVTGIGLITAASILLYTNNFKSFNNPRKFNCYCGLAPFEYTSGTSVKRKDKTSRYRNKELKKLLFNAANTAIRHDQQIKTYFNRKTKEGKHKMSVINAVACKIIYRVFAVANRDEPYVNFSV
ncbi:MAG: hypothetical protein CL663_08170 [Bacteroidetes bacterium]|nr:hypothetical protein [Bacteroidota bacterium]|tara:strand:- start:51 stop:1043 length:993 start_codon:yes stop_codon:yes gene_type:complete